MPSTSLSFKLRTPRRISEMRRGLYAGTYEGITALIVMNAIGGPFLTGYLLWLGASSQQIGLALAIQPLANTLQIVAAFYMQKFQNRKLALTLLGTTHRVLWLLTGLIPFVVPKEWWIPVYFLLYSMSFMLASTGGVVWSSLISDMVPGKLRGRYFGIRNAVCWAIGSIVLLISGQIMESYPGMEGFSILFIIAAVATGLNFHGYLLYTNPPFEASSSSSKMGMLAAPLKDRTFIRAALFIAVFVLIQNVTVPLFSYVMLDVIQIGYSWVSALTTVQMVAMMIGYYLWGNWNMRYPTRTLLFWTLPIIAASCLLWLTCLLFPVIPVLFFAHMLLGFGLGGYQLLAFNFIVGDTPKSERPMYIAVFSALSGITGFLGPLLGGYLFQSAAGAPAWIAGYGIIGATGAALMLLVVFGRRMLLNFSR